MARLTFEDLEFTEEEKTIKVKFLKIFETHIKKSDLKKLGKFKVEKHAIDFKEATDQKANKQFNFILATSFQDLTNKVTGKPTVYVHQNSGIPLIGNLAFGKIDRNTNLI